MLNVLEIGESFTKKAETSSFSLRFNCLQIRAETKMSEEDVSFAKSGIFPSFRCSLRKVKL